MMPFGFETRRRPSSTERLRDRRREPDAEAAGDERGVQLTATSRTRTRAAATGAAADARLLVHRHRDEHVHRCVRLRRRQLRRAAHADVRRPLETRMARALLLLREHGTRSSSGSTSATALMRRSSARSRWPVARRGTVLHIVSVIDPHMAFPAVPAERVDAAYAEHVAGARSTPSSTAELEDQENR